MSSIDDFADIGVDVEGQPVSERTAGCAQQKLLTTSGLRFRLGAASDAAAIPFWSIVAVTVALLTRPGTVSCPLTAIEKVEGA